MIPNVEQWAYELLTQKYQNDNRVIGVYKDLIEEQDINLDRFNHNPQGVTILVEASVEQQVMIARKHLFDSVKLLVSVKSFDSIAANIITDELTKIFRQYGFNSHYRKESKDINENGQGTKTQQVLADFINHRFNGFPYNK